MSSNRRDRPLASSIEYKIDQVNVQIGQQDILDIERFDWESGRFVLPNSSDELFHAPSISANRSSAAFPGYEENTLIWGKACD